MQQINDKFRGMKGAFAKALTGIRNCLKAGIKVGLRFTINKRNVADVPDIFSLLTDENIPRVCFYHLVYSGRGSALMKEDLDHAQTRRVVDLIIDRTAELHGRGISKEVLTVDNHTDGPYLYLRMVQEKNPRVVGFTSVTPTFDNARHLAREIKKILNPFIIVGGPHSSAVPDEAMGCRGIDGVVIGEAEESIGEFMDHFKKGALRPVDGMIIRKDSSLLRGKPRDDHDN